MCKVEQWVIDFLKSKTYQSCHVKNDDKDEGEYTMIKGIVLDEGTGYLFIDQFGEAWKYARPIKFEPYSGGTKVKIPKQSKGD